jgi:hypothetical protein
MSAEIGYTLPLITLYIYFQFCFRDIKLDYWIFNFDDLQFFLLTYFAHAQHNFTLMATPILNIIFGLMDFFQVILIQQLLLSILY